MTEESYSERVNRIKREREARIANEAAARGEAAPAPVEHDTDLIPEAEPYQRDEVDEEIDLIVGRIDVIEAYRRWCGKMEPNAGNKRESIKISCPNPNHPDKDPSAWIGLDKGDGGVWVCGGCDFEGGDKYDIAAWHFGYDVPGYKQGKSFPELKRKMAEDMGFVVRKTLGGARYVEPVTEVESDSEELLSAPSDDESPDHSTFVKPPSEPSSEPEVSSPADTSDGTHLKAVPPLAGSDEAEAPVSQTDSSSVLTFPSPLEMYGPKAPPSINWASLIPPDTFLYKWMDILEHDDLPEEYYFWHGLTGVGLSVGRDAYLHDRTPVFGNLFTCLYGHSGQGKSRSTRHLIIALRNALPHDVTNEFDTGTYISPMPGSSEALIDVFSRPYEDPSDPKKKLHGTVRGLVVFDELSTLIGRAGRAGNPMKPILQQFYDMDEYVATKSRGMGEVIAYQPTCSVITTTQPRAIRDILISTDVDSGFANRWVFVMGPSKRAIPIGGPSIDTEPTWDLLRGIRTWAATTRRKVNFSPSGESTWEEFYFDEIDPIKNSDDFVMLTRVDLTLKKIMLLLAINQHSVVVDDTIVNAAIELYEYLRGCYLMVSGDLGSGLTSDMDKAIVAAVQNFHTATSKWPSARDIWQRLGKAHKNDSGMFHRQLKILTDIGVLDAHQVKPAKGRPTERYSYEGYGA